LKYSIVLSTTGTRLTLEASVNNFEHFTRTRNDTELIIGTNNPSLEQSWVTKPSNAKIVCRPDHRVCWSDAIDASSGEFIVNVDDDLKLATDYLTTADHFFADSTLQMIQPTLLDAEGYVCLRKHYRSYTISVFRRILIEELGMDYDGRGSRWPENNIPFVEATWEKASVAVAMNMYAVHYGYPTHHGIDSTIAPYGNRLDFLEEWRKENNYERISLETILP